MEYYESKSLEELIRWQQQMQHNPSLLNKASKALQDKINGVIPDKVHQIITVTIQKMVQVVLFGSKYTTSKHLSGLKLIERELLIKTKTENYRIVATTEGVVTGASGILLGLADFPILMGIKIKLLFEISAIYGYQVKDYRERIYILYIFQIAFSSQKRRQEIYKKIESWEEYSSTLPEKVEEFDWRSFQQEYRDYIDLVKLAQLIPLIGAAVGGVANYKLVNHLSDTAKNAYRMRYFKHKII
jgi:hypothetical protein